MTQSKKAVFTVAVIAALAITVLGAVMLMKQREVRLDEAIEIALQDPPKHFKEFIDTLKKNYAPTKGTEEFWYSSRKARGNAIWTLSDLTVGQDGQVHWLNGGTIEKVEYIYAIQISGGGGCWGGGGPRGTYHFYVGLNDELYGWHTQGILPPK